MANICRGAVSPRVDHSLFALQLRHERPRGSAWRTTSQGRHALRQCGRYQPASRPALVVFAKKDKQKAKHNHESNKDEDGSDEPTFPVPNWEGIERKAHYSDSRPIEMAEEKKRKEKDYDHIKELERLQLELVKLQEWIKRKGLRVVTIFEGRDAAGKGGLIKTITAPLNPRVASVHALGTPSDREKTQWYFQRYVNHLPAAGEWVIFDRSWYNRAGVEKVMGFCKDEEYQEFLRTCPMFERMLMHSGLILIKYWVSVSPEVQLKRFQERLARPEKRWKLSPMDLYARERWSDYSYAKDVMFQYTDIKQAPWYVINGDHKKSAHLNCLTHLLSLFDYEDLIIPLDLKIPDLKEDTHVRPPLSEQTFIPEIY